MKKIIFSLLTAVGTLALSGGNLAAQGHYHLYVGAFDTNQNGQLFFDDTTLTPADTFVSTLNYTNAGTYAGYYQPGGLTIAVLAQLEANGGHATFAPAFGSWIFVRVVSVQGPSGGAFGFWEAGATNPTFSVPVGTTNGTNVYRSGQNDGSPGTDPYGHIHGRIFSATKPGLYTIGFQAFDNSTNGAGGGPIQTQSAVYNFRWQAGMNITSFGVTNGVATATFPAIGGQSVVLQSKDSLDSTNWQAVGDAVTGDDHFHSITDNAATNSTRVYRLLGTAQN